MSERFAALKRAIATEGPYPMDYWGNKDPRCPHCGEVCEISDNGWYELYDEGEHEVSCPHCGEDFTVSTRVSFSFGTDEQGDMDEDDEPSDEADPIHSQGAEP